MFRPAHLLAATALTVVAATSAAPTAAPALAQSSEVPEVLVWGGAYGFRHSSITQAEAAFQQLALETGAFNVRVTENPAELTATILQDIDVLVWVSTTGKPPFTEQQRDEIIRFAGCGGGTLAFHAAADSNYGWPEYAELLGVQFDSHPQGAGAGESRMIVEDNTHTIMEGWAGVDEFMLDDEYYRWRTAQGLPEVSLPRAMDDVHVLLSLDETTVSDGIQDGPLRYEHHQPIAWTKTFREAGRVYYNNMGHSDQTWSVPEFRTSLVNGIDWVSEVQLDPDCYGSSDELPAPAGPPAADPALRGQACPIPDMPERTGFTWQVSAAIKALTEDGDELTLPTAGIPGNLSWGAQFYVLDLSATGADTATVDIDLTIPVPSDDYDLSVTTGWGWYGSQQGPGATVESLQLTDIPHCSILQVYGDNMYATSQNAPSLKVAVAPNTALEPAPVAPAPEPAPEPTPDAAPSTQELPATGVPASVLTLAPAMLGLAEALRRTRRR